MASQFQPEPGEDGGERYDEDRVQGLEEAGRNGIHRETGTAIHQQGNISVDGAGGQQAEESEDGRPQGPFIGTQSGGGFAVEGINIVKQSGRQQVDAPHGDAQSQAAVGLFVGEEGQRGAGLFEGAPEEYDEEGDDEDDGDPFLLQHGEGFVGENDESDQQEGADQQVGQEAEDIRVHIQESDHQYGQGCQADAHEQGACPPLRSVHRRFAQGFAIRIDDVSLLEDILNDDAQEHADAGSQECPLEVCRVAGVAHESAYKGPQCAAHVDAHIKDGVGGIYAPVVLGIELSDEGGDVRFEEAVAGDHEAQAGEEEQGGEGLVRLIE